jgi:teichuronic acid biosynthesis glycosyltransferase TuaC
MKVLIVCSGNSGDITSFVKEQAEATAKFGVQIDFYLINGRGIVGYLKNYPALLKKIRFFKPDLIHAHYGLSGLLACLQRKIKVITTYHGNDINPLDKIGHSSVKSINPFTYLALKLSSYNIFVTEELQQMAKQTKKYSIISCGVELEDFFEMDKDESRKKMQLSSKKKYILFSSSFENTVKNYPLAKKVMDTLNDGELIELKGYNRKEVAVLMNACDVLFVTSRNESGPLVIKEAMACGCPIVSTDVGDVKEVIANTEGCYIGSFNPDDLHHKLIQALQFAQLKNRTNGRQRIINLGLDNKIIAQSIFNVYHKTLFTKRTN